MNSDFFGWWEALCSAEKLAPDYEAHRAEYDAENARAEKIRRLDRRNLTPEHCAALDEIKQYQMSVRAHEDMLGQIQQQLIVVNKLLRDVPYASETGELKAFVGKLEYFRWRRGRTLELLRPKLRSLEQALAESLPAEN
jgi:hypothetical protein